MTKEDDVDLAAARRALAQRLAFARATDVIDEDELAARLGDLTAIERAEADLQEASKTDGKDQKF